MNLNRRLPPSSLQGKCPQLVAPPGMRISDADLRELNDEVHFTCANGNRWDRTPSKNAEGSFVNPFLAFSLFGHSPLRCLPSGRWSHPTPACLAVSCPESAFTGRPPPEPGLRVDAHGSGVGDRVTFACAPGHVLRGPAEAECGKDGKWSVWYRTGRHRLIDESELAYNRKSRLIECFLRNRNWAISRLSNFNCVVRNHDMWLSNQYWYR